MSENTEKIIDFLRQPGFSFSLAFLLTAGIFWVYNEFNNFFMRSDYLQLICLFLVLTIPFMIFNVLLGIFKYKKFKDTLPTDSKMPFYAAELIITGFAIFIAITLVMFIKWLIETNLFDSWLKFLSTVFILYPVFTQIILIILIGWLLNSLVVRLIRKFGN